MSLPKSPSYTLSSSLLPACILSVNCSSFSLVTLQRPSHPRSLFLSNTVSFLSSRTLFPPLFLSPLFSSPPSFPSLSLSPVFFQFNIHLFTFRSLYLVQGGRVYRICFCRFVHPLRPTPFYIYFAFRPSLSCVPSLSHRTEALKCTPMSHTPRPLTPPPLLAYLLPYP